MIVLDTNVVSEPLRHAPDKKVVRWLNTQDRGHLYVTTVVAAELLSGAELLPTGRRRSMLEGQIAAALHRFGDARILPFDLSAARCFAVIVARARRAGRSIGPMDAQIAAIAASRGFAVATRDAEPFIAAGIGVIDPWTAGG